MLLLYVLDKAQHSHNKVDVMCESVYCGIVIIDYGDRKYELLMTGKCPLNHMWGHLDHGVIQQFNVFKIKAVL